MHKRQLLRGIVIRRVLLGVVVAQRQEQSLALAPHIVAHRDRVPVLRGVRAVVVAVIFFVKVIFVVAVAIAVDTVGSGRGHRDRCSGG